MKLSIQEIKENREAFLKAGIALPAYDIEEVHRKTAENPVWIHFGAGNIFRGYIAGLQEVLLNEGKADRGILAAETFDGEIIDKIYRPFDSLTLMVTLMPDGSTKSRIQAAIADGIKANVQDPAEFEKLVRAFRNPGLQMISFTVTEKGYALRGIDGELMNVVKSDMEKGPSEAKHAMSIVAALLYERYQAGGYPLAVVSMDNCSHNGEKLKAAVLEVAEAWEKTGFVPAGFIAYIEDEAKVSFPWSMIDKITPRPAKSVEEHLTELGMEDMAPVITGKKTFIAPFVNAEEAQYLVIEDRFPNGRPALEKAGVYLTDRDTVNRVERMKVTTCLNPLHTALAVYGCLLGYHLIADEMKDEELVKLVEKIGYVEGMPVVTDPGIISPKGFIDEVIGKRLPNPYMPDTPQRIATDTSQKIPVRFGETLKSYVAAKDLDPSALTFIPLALAGWLRYLLGTDDNLEAMELSADPMLDELKNLLAGVSAGNPASYTGQLKGFLGNANVFGVDLYQAGLAGKVEGMFTEMLAGKGAVRATLKKYLD